MRSKQDSFFILSRIFYILQHLESITEYSSSKKMNNDHDSARVTVGSQYCTGVHVDGETSLSSQHFEATRNAFNDRNGFCFEHHHTRLLYTVPSYTSIVRHRRKQIERASLLVLDASSRFLPPGGCGSLFTMDEFRGSPVITFFSIGQWRTVQVLVGATYR